MTRTTVFLLCFCLISFSLFSKKLKEGIYRGVLFLNEEQKAELPFNFIVQYKDKKPTITILNADERIVVDEIVLKGDSVNFRMPVFDTEFRTIRKGNTLEGVWINHYKAQKKTTRFRAVHGESRRFLSPASTPNPLFQGEWEVCFSPGLKDSTKALAIFHHTEQTDHLTGTFLTETGDFRYLEGTRSGDSLFLSAFDGSHAFLFTARYQEGTLSGNFYSGNSWQENWTGRRNSGFRLRDAESISYMKNPGETISFSFPDLEGRMVSLSDKQFENKPLIIQIMGSWCPNCMDESVYFSSLYKQYRDEGLEIIALAFERTSDPDRARSQVARLKTRLGLEYRILITLQTGKDKAGEVLPALNKITAFPTTLFLNKAHQVVKVHTGFNGPATGKEYEVYRQRTESLIRQLLKE
jgi:thiol-disulfide isomerase/thioredoxin